MLVGAHKWGVLARAVWQLEEKDCVELIPLLIQHGVEIDLRNADDKTALHLAAFKGRSLVPPRTHTHKHARIHTHA